MTIFFILLGRYLFNLVLMLDCAVNTLLGGDYREFISSRIGKLVRQWKANNSNAARFYIARAICWGLSLIDKDHCEKEVQATESEIGSFDIWEIKKRLVQEKRKKAENITGNSQLDTSG
jgi:hypothetical protein